MSDEVSDQAPGGDLGVLVGDVENAGDIIDDKQDVKNDDLVDGKINIDGKQDMLLNIDGKIGGNNGDLLGMTSVDSKKVSDDVVQVTKDLDVVTKKGDRLVHGDVQKQSQEVSNKVTESEQRPSLDLSYETCRGWSSLKELVFAAACCWARRVYG